MPCPNPWSQCLETFPIVFVLAIHSIKLFQAQEAMHPLSGGVSLNYMDMYIAIIYCPILHLIRASSAEVHHLSSEASHNLYSDVHRALCTGLAGLHWLPVTISSDHRDNGISTRLPTEFQVFFALVPCFSWLLMIRITWLARARTSSFLFFLFQTSHRVGRPGHFSHSGFKHNQHSN